MGWEPTTTYVHDDAGRLVSSTPEVEWDDAERGWMQALQHYRDEVLCPLCGWPKSVCRSYEADGNIDVSYERCHVTAALGRRQKAAAQDETVEFPESFAYMAKVHQDQPKPE